MRLLLSDIRRSLRVLSVIAKFGAVPLARYVLRLPQSGTPYPVRIRLALEQLGTTYLKLGQFMAMRFDLLPMEICNELRRLFEDVAPLPFSIVKEVVETELNGTLDKLFLEFSRHPMAAASIAQVHEARNHNNDRLAVKVQRPRIDIIFEADMRILGRLAAAIDALGSLPGIVVSDIMAEFATYTRREMDFILEGTTAENLRDHATAHEKVPRIHWAMTTRRVLTMEFIEGLSVGHAGRLLQEEGLAAVQARLPNFDPEKALRNLAFASLHQFFGTGFFHADPHPGNILLLADNEIAFVDFGIFGALTEEKRALLTGYSENVAVGNIDQAYQYYAKLSVPTGLTDLAAFKRETKAVLFAWYEASERLDSPLSDRHVGKIVGDITDILRRHFVRIDLDTLLFWRAAIALDSSALTLTDRFDLMSEMRSYFESEHPGIVRRVLDVALDGERARAMRDLIVTGPPLGRRMVDELAAQQYSASVSLQEPLAGRRRGRRETRAAGLALLSISGLIAMPQLQDNAIRITAILALLCIPILSVLALRSWHK
jgi:ubiquinone biosynthesis protein